MKKDVFQLKPFKAAKVSEISEATAAAPVQNNERVNFHIGHPIQDERLTTYFRQLVFQAEHFAQVQSREGLSAFLKDQGAEEPALSQAAFVYDAISSCNPYMARGGYNRQAPGPLIERIQHWFEGLQLEPIHYDTGQESGQKELMLGSGGIIENVRVLLFMLNRSLQIKPAAVFVFNVELPDYLQRLKQLQFQSLPGNEAQTLLFLEKWQKRPIKRPHFLLLGSIPSEKFRRRLREIILTQPLFAVELNNAPNHLSLAREALLADRVLRFLSPEALRPDLTHHSIVIAAGRADYIRHLETIHFELKGTPSAPEAELLRYLLEQPASSVDAMPQKTPAEDTITINPLSSPLQPAIPAMSALQSSLKRLAQRETELLDGRNITTINSAQKAAARLQTLSLKMKAKTAALSRQAFSLYDSFAVLSPTEVIEQFFKHLHNSAWTDELKENFLNTFVAVHPEYNRAHCLIVSGSSRTTLGLLGFFGPIKKAACLDLSWTYEHCFPQVEVLPLNPLQPLSAAEFIEQMEHLIEQDASWLENGAIVLNNPHNATGRILAEEELKKLLLWAFERGVFVIDDLSYRNLGPWPQPKRIKTLKQLTVELMRKGYIVEEGAKRLITVHSLSKTDSFAGARLTVAEIPDDILRPLFAECLQPISQHRLPLLIAYLFYRNGAQKVEAYWDFRNRLFAERLNWLQKAVNDLPKDRNIYKGRVLSPEGSMYPLLFIHNLPGGISLDALSSNLANQGIGLVPLSSFARTAKGYETARSAFRLTLGGKTGGEHLYYQMRKVLIDLNRLIAQEASAFQKKTFKFAAPFTGQLNNSEQAVWQETLKTVQTTALNAIANTKKSNGNLGARYRQSFADAYLPSRLSGLNQLFEDRLNQWAALQNMGEKVRRTYLERILSKEFYKDDLTERQQRFRGRLMDRTVHPTQMFSLAVDRQARKMTDKVLLGKQPSSKEIKRFAHSLISEFLGYSVPVNSVQEADELLLDLDSFIEAEWAASQFGNDGIATFLSFWGDWDGSTRPSGQGHRLVGAVVIENVSRLAGILSLLLQIDPDLKINSGLLNELQSFPQRRDKFWQLLNKITVLTNQLEKRYRSLLPVQVSAGHWRKLGMKLRLFPDPLSALWAHNDRLERKMRQLRNQRRQGLEYYFLLNKNLRKALHAAIPAILTHSDHPELLFHAGFYRDLLKRFVLTPRIHQNMITSVDPFAIDTTVFNLTEINALGGSVGNAGLILALQVSMTSKTEALIQLDQKLHAQKEAALRRRSETQLPNIWIVPLFEDIKVVKQIELYLDELWNYARGHRSTAQSPEERFSQMVCEIFIAGSDLSQQVSQPMAAYLYKETKFKAVKWLAKKGLLNRVRLKLGSGEPMQRQGGFYDKVGSQPAFVLTEQNKKRIARELPSSTIKSTEYAITPLRGVMSSGDLRTFQSAIAEKMRMSNVTDRANLLYHIKTLQKYHDHELIRAGEPLILTRLQYREQGEKELKRLTLGWTDPLYNQFLNIVSENFRQIVYGRDEDVVGIHVVSYFVSKMTPPFRDRPTIRPGSASRPETGQRIVDRLTRVLPLSKHGTLLRAIGHNRAQTLILGINQLTTGLFRAFNEFCNTQQGDLSPEFLLQERILPSLPVYEILHTLRVYQDIHLEFFSHLEKLFPPGNSALFALHEDVKLINEFIPFLQIELLKRHGLPVADFFENGFFKEALIPALRPDLAVLLQKDLFNIRPEKLFARRNGKGIFDKQWEAEIERLLRIPEQVRQWRTEIWRLIEEKVAVQVESFIQLSQAIDVLLKNQAANGTSFNSPFQRSLAQLSSGLQSISDDTLKHFLLASLHYLNNQAQSAAELPVNVIRALRDVERIVKIEQQPLSTQEQDRLRFYILQIARLTGENG